MDAKMLRKKYRLHYCLRKKGNEVIAKNKMVTKRAKVVSPIENKWLRQLSELGYCVVDGIFTPPHYLDLDN